MAHGTRLLIRFDRKGNTGRQVTLRVNTINQGLIILAMGATGTMQELRIIFRAVRAVGLRLWSPIDRPWGFGGGAVGMRAFCRGPHGFSHGMVVQWARAVEIQVLVKADGRAKEEGVATHEHYRPSP